MIGILYFLISSCSNTNHYQFTITDERSGEQLAARVAVTDPYGRTIPIDGNQSQLEYLEKQWCYTDGSFSVTTSHKGGTIEIMRGPETVPLEISFGKGSKNQIIELHRWTDMAKKGYMKGDIHIHYPYSETAHLQMKAEDLNIVNVLIVENSGNKNPFIGQIDSSSTPGHSVYMDQEVRDWQMGHCTLLGLSSRVTGYSAVGGVNLLAGNNNPHRLLAHALDETHRQGGFVAWSHFSNLPGSELPIAVALGKVDAIELMTFDDPTRLPSHRSAWTNSGFSQAEFPIMRGIDLYYQFLNAGFRLPIAAGTDKPAMVDLPMGSNRFYGFTNGDTSYKAWLSALKSGSGFITNSPILTFEVDGHSWGDVVNFHEPKKVHAKVTAQSILPLTNIEIVVNGRVVKQESVFAKDNPPVDGVYSMSLEADLQLDKSSWISARIVDASNNRIPVLPRDLSVFAHTNPVYFLKDGARIKEKASIFYLQKYVQGTINWLNTNPTFNNPDDRIEALKLAHEAFGIYESLKK